MLLFLLWRCVATITMLPKVDGCEIAVIGGGCPDIKACLEHVGLVIGVLEWSMYIVVPLVEEFFLINAFEECHMVLLVAHVGPPHCPKPPAASPLT